MAGPGSLDGGTNRPEGPYWVQFEFPPYVDTLSLLTGSPSCSVLEFSIATHTDQRGACPRIDAGKDFEVELPMGKAALPLHARTHTHTRLPGSQWGGKSGTGNFGKWGPGFWVGVFPASGHDSDLGQIPFFPWDSLSSTSGG